MTTFRCAALITFLLCVPFNTAITLLAEEKSTDHYDHWSYDGNEGPDGWGDLTSDYCKCKVGNSQSPIGISVTEKAHLHTINFHYYPTPLKIIHNGHTMQINYGSGSIITIGNKEYKLIQFHFHTPSEHKLNGVSYPIEVHLVHKDNRGDLAVVGIFIEAGKENEFIRAVWNCFPKDIGKEHTISEVKINASQLLPQDTAVYYNYNGSLTTPPCSENVNWFILKTPIQASKSEIEKFTSIFKNNARPVQPVHGRVVKENNSIDEKRLP